MAKAFWISCDPNKEVRDQEELEYNIGTTDQDTLNIQITDHKENLQSNKQLRKLKKHKIKLPKFEFTLTYRDFHTHKNKKRRQLPIKEYNFFDLSKLCKAKRIQWNPGCGFKSLKTVSFLFVQDNPMIVLDIDDVHWEEVKKTLEEKWTQKIPFSISPSTSGSGAHIHIWVDLSMINGHRPYAESPSEIAMAYKHTPRHAALMALKAWVAKSIQKDTSLVIDMYATRREMIAVTPEEIGRVNQFWEGKEPYVFKRETIKTAITEFETPQERKSKEFMSPFFEELQKFLEDPNAVDEVLHFLREINIEPGKREYYEQVIGNMLANREEIQRHLSKSLDSISWLRSKQEGISIARATCAKELFGFESKKNLTYVRHVAQYIWSLAVTDVYKVKKKTNLYGLVDVEKKYFGSDFLIENWYAKPRHIIDLTVDTLATKMGQGNTWKTICDFSPHARYHLGEKEGLSRMLTALEMSGANNKHTRSKEIVSFFSYMRSNGQAISKKAENRENANVS